MSPSHPPSRHANPHNLVTFGYSMLPLVCFPLVTLAHVSLSGGVFAGGDGKIVLLRPGWSIVLWRPHQIASPAELER